MELSLGKFINPMRSQILLSFFNDFFEFFVGYDYENDINIEKFYFNGMDACSLIRDAEPY